MHRSPAEVHADRLLTLRIWFERCKLDARARLATTQRGVWFVCRYGNQPYDYVVNQPKSWLFEAAKHLTDWISAEAPKPTGGGASTTHGSW